MMKTVSDLSVLIFWVERALMAASVILMSFPAFSGHLSPIFLFVTLQMIIFVIAHSYETKKKEFLQKNEFIQKKKLYESDDHDLFFAEKTGIFVLIIYLITGHEFALIVVMSIFLVTNLFYYVISTQRAVTLAPGAKTDEEEFEDLKEIKLRYEKYLEEFKDLKEELYENWILERGELLGKIAYYEGCCNSYNEELYEVMVENRRLWDTLEEYKRRCANISADDYNLESVD